MSLLQLLQEASSLDLSSLKKAMQKDKNASLIFKKDLNLDDIDPDSFLATIKFYVLNNENVKRFVASRNDVKNVDLATFTDYKNLRGNELDQQKLDNLQKFIQNIFREFSHLENSGISKDLKKILDSWFNTSGHYNNLPLWAENELDALTDIKPTKRVVLYRGILFSKDTVSEQGSSYNGTLSAANGLKFLKSIREDEPTVELDWDHPSSWTKSKEIATQFAKYGPVSSQYGAMLQWFDRSISEHSVDWALGYVVAVYADPEDVLIDTDKFAARFHIRHGDESEVILKPGKYLVKMIKKYTNKSEIMPEAVSDIDTSHIEEAFNKMESFLSKPIIDEDVSKLSSDDFRSQNVIELMNDWASFKKLVLNSTTTQVLHAYDKIIDTYAHIFKDIAPDDLLANKYADDEIRKKVEKLKRVFAWYNGSIHHPKFKEEQKGSLTGPRWKFGADDVRKTLTTYDVDVLEKPLLTGRRITEREGGRALFMLAQFLDVKLPSSASIHMLNNDNQSKIIDDILNNFFKKLNITKNADRMENIRVLINLLKKASRNEKMIHIIKDFCKKFKDKK